MYLGFFKYHITLVKLQNVKLKMAGIYFHIPFCKQACNYCNFFFTTSVKSLHETTSALKRELQLRQDYLLDEKISSIYFGGGTPSMFAPSEIQSLIAEVQRLYDVEQDVEITLEANPENLTVEYLQALKSTDVNRFSIGIQSFFQDELQWMNRAHDATEAKKCIENTRNAGYENFSIDLILGVPISNIKRWQENIEQLLQYRPHHISCYALTVEKGTALHHQIQKGTVANVIDSDVEEQFLFAHDSLEEAGYSHYEISNYALEGKASRHNSSYWESAHYLGIGPSAHSYNGTSRSWNISHLPKYLEAVGKGIPEITTEELTTSDQYNEWVMTSIRKKKGLDLELLNGKYRAFQEYFFEMLQEIPPQYILQKADQVSLSRSGLLFADFVGSELFHVDL